MITKKVPALLLAEAQGIAAFQAAWPEEFEPQQIAALLAGGRRRENRSAYCTWERAVSSGIKNGILPVRSEERPNPWFNSRRFPDSSPTSQSRFISRRACEAWLKAIGQEPSEHIAEWLRTGEPTHPPVCSGANAAPVGIPKGEIVSVQWPLYGQFNQVSLDAALSDVPTWLKPARSVRGSPGKGSSLWNPALIAACLLGKSYANEKALCSFLGRSFAEWLPEWEKLQSYQ